MTCDAAKRLYDKITSQGWDSLSREELVYVLHLIKEAKFLNDILEVIQKKRNEHD